MAEYPAQKSSCFVLMSTDGGLVNLWDAVIAPAIQRVGMAALRTEDLVAGANIMQQVRRHILQSAVVVAVVTGADPNVIYALGLAHAAKKKVLLLQEKGEPHPLAFSHLHFLEYNPRDFPKSREALAITLARVMGTKEIDDLFPELEIPSPLIMEEYRYLKRTSRTLTVRVVPEYCSIFFNNRYLGRSPQTIAVNPDEERNVVSISAIEHFEHYQEISVSDLAAGFLDITLEHRERKKYPERVHSWLMWRRKDPDSPVLSLAIASYLIDQNKFDQAREEVLLCIAKAPQWFHGYNALGFLELCEGNLKEAKRHLQMGEALEGGFHFSELYLACTESLDGNPEIAINHLESILKSPSRSESFRQIHSRDISYSITTDQVFENLRKSATHKTKFASLAKRFEQLQLSKPPPLIPLSSPAARQKSDLPLTLKRFEIRDFQCIQSTGLDHLPADAPWIMITGDNGDGKTSLLQALALGLHGTEDGEQLLKSNSATRIGIEMREGAQVVMRDFSRRDGHWTLINPVVNLVTYGPFRLDIAAEETIASEGAERSPVYSLLRQRGSLRNMEHWLKMRTLDADDISRQRVNRVKEVLIELMPGVSHMELVGSEFKYTENGHQVTANNLSSGQVSLLAMVGDLLIRLYATHPTTVNPEELQGIVLIDELDVHLHPNRQKELPGQLSRLFPNVQFIATTHSVIPILGAPPGSVFLRVVRDPLQGTQVERPDIEIGNLLPNAVLSSPLFGMVSILAKQNKNPAKVNTDDDYQEIQRNKQVDAALNQLAKGGNVLPDGFLDPEE